MDNNPAAAVCRQWLDAMWNWEESAISAQLESLGWQLVQRVGHRLQYRLSGGLEADVYCHQRRVESIEITLEAFTDSDSLDDLEYEDMVDDYYAKFLSLTEKMQAAIGTPVFSDGAAARGFPEDQDAVWVSMWTSATARVMVQQRHEDRELPFRICLVAAPPN